MRRDFPPEDLPILHARMERLERLGSALSPSQVATERLVTFRRAEARYALTAADLRGVQRLPKVTRLPQTPPHVLGLAHLNGRVIAVLDLERLVRPDAPIPALPWALWLAHDACSVLLVADELLELMDIEVSRLGGEVRGAFAGPLGGRLRAVLPGPLSVLDGRQLLDSKLYRAG